MIYEQTYTYFDIYAASVAWYMRKRIMQSTTAVHNSEVSSFPECVCVHSTRGRVGLFRRFPSIQPLALLLS